MHTMDRPIPVSTNDRVSGGGGAYHKAIYHLVQPELPFIMEAKFLGPNTYHSPSVQQENAEHDDVKHDLGAESKSFLDHPKAINTH